MESKYSLEMRKMRWKLKRQYCNLIKRNDVNDVKPVNYFTLQVIICKKCDHFLIDRKCVAMLQISQVTRSRYAQTWKQSKEKLYSRRYAEG